MKCEYCGRETRGGNHHSKHRDACLKGPVMAEVITFVASISKNGIMPGKREYEEKRPKSLPSSVHLVRSLGWIGLATLCGLEVTHRRGGKNKGVDGFSDERMRTACNRAEEAHRKDLREAERVYGGWNIVWPPDTGEPYYPYRKRTVESHNGAVVREEYYLELR